MTILVKEQTRLTLHNRPSRRLAMKMAAAARRRQPEGSAAHVADTASSADVHSIERSTDFADPLAYELPGTSEDTRADDVEDSATTLELVLDISEDHWDMSQEFSDET